MAGAEVSTAAERPLNVLFSARPFRGHLHPLIPLARAFRLRGHQVAVATAEDMATVVTGAGLTWLPAGTGFPRSSAYARSAAEWPPNRLPRCQTGR